MLTIFVTGLFPFSRIGETTGGAAAFFVIIEAMTGLMLASTLVQMRMLIWRAITNQKSGISEEVHGDVVLRASP